MAAVLGDQLNSQVVDLYLNATCFGVISKGKLQLLAQLESTADAGEMKLIRHLHVLIKRRRILVRRAAS